MIEIFMVVCQLVNIDVCKEQRIDFVSKQIAPMQLEIIAQRQGAEWCNQNPGWFIRKIGSRRVGLEARA